jgi:hypothetical protein
VSLLTTEVLFARLKSRGGKLIMKEVAVFFSSYTRSEVLKIVVIFLKLGSFRCSFLQELPENWLLEYSRRLDTSMINISSLRCSSCIYLKLRLFRCSF